MTKVSNQDKFEDYDKSLTSLVDGIVVGWSDRDDLPPYEQSYTWFSVYVRRADGRQEPQQKMVQCNRRANSNFHSHHIHWDYLESDPSTKEWLASLVPGDTLQLFARACYPGWVNIVQEAEMIVEYETSDASSIDSSLGEVMDELSISESVYQPLDQLKQEIRLLVIHPGKLHDPIFCSLVHHELSAEENLDFEALSYCWGNINDRTFVLLKPSVEDGDSPKGKLVLPRTAEAAIRQLRRNDDRVRRVWIDAVCINQLDLEERAQQVSIMSEIYSKAQRVVIWLGQSSDQSTMSFKMIRDIYNSVHRICPGGLQCQCSGTAHDLVPAEANLPDAVHKRMTQIFWFHQSKSNIPESSSFGSLTAIFGNAWFRRVWVFQEALRSRQAMIYCGSDSMPWDELVAVNDYIHFPGHTFLHMAPQTFMPTLWSKVIQDKRRRLESAHNDDIDLRFLDVYISSLGLEATDPRDRIFALLSFGSDTEYITNLPQEIRPDYNKSVSHVFADATKWWILKYRSLKILSTIHGLTGRTWQSLHCPTTTPLPPTRPTWALGYHGKAHWAMASLCSQYDFKAGGKTAVDISLLRSGVQTSPLVLPLRGYRVASITQITHFPLDHVVQRGPSRLKEVFLTIMDPTRIVTSWVSAMDEAAMQKRDRDLERMRQNMFQHQAAHWKYGPRPKLEVADVVGEKDEMGKLPLIESQCCPSCTDRCFFVASDGSIGLCPAEAREGDTVVLFFGGNVPYLIREMPRSGAQFELVGECFADHLVDGDDIEKRLADNVASEVFPLV